MKGGVSGFASLVDEMLAAEPAAGGGRAFSFDPLSIAIHRRDLPALPEDAVASEYLSFAAEPEPVEGGPAAVPEAEEDAPPLPTDPAEVAAELDLPRDDAAALARIRRDFAFRNHPDRVAPRHHERALARMQIANALIDEAERRIFERDARSA